MKQINLLPDVKPALLTCGFIDDFEYLRLDETGSEGRWFTLDSDSGASVAHDADGMNGIVTLTTGTTDDNEALMWSPYIMQYVVGKPVLIAARMKITTADTTTPKVAFGLCDSVGANQILTSDVGLSGALDSISFYKNEGVSNWRMEHNDSSTRTTKDLQGDITSGQWSTLAMHIDPISASECIYTPLMDLAGGNNLQQPLEKDASARCPAAQLRLPFTASNPMAVYFAVKASSAATQVLDVDLAIYQKVR